MKYDFSGLENIFNAIDSASVEKAVNAINTHKKIFVYGAGRSGLMLKALAMRLAQAGRTVYVVGETVTPAIEKNDLLILASASGTTQSVLRYAETAKKVGADLYIITASQESPLSKIAGDVGACLPAPTKDTQSVKTCIMGSLFEQALLLFADYIIASLNENTDKMRKRHANLE